MSKYPHKINLCTNLLGCTYLYILYLHLILKLMPNNVINFLLFHYYIPVTIIAHFLVNLNYFNSI